MARTRIYRAQVRATTLKVAVPFIEQVLYELDFQAKSRILHGPYTTGNLALSLRRVGPVVSANRVSGRLGSGLPYAASVQSGVQPHVIHGRGPWRLKFYWRKVGRVVRPWSVNHPGQRGKHYLTESLLDVARRNNMEVIITDF